MSKPKRTISFRQRAAIVLSQLYRVAEVHRSAGGEILPAGPWLKVLANILSACPEGHDGDRRARRAPQYFGLNKATLALAARNCGLDATVEQIEAQVADTRAWRERESGRIGRRHYAPMRPDKIGELLGVTDTTREAAQAWNVGTLGGSRAARAKAAKERDRTYQKGRRAEQGAVPRQEYEGESLSRLKPWEIEGISRATWYRRQASDGQNETSPSATNKGTTRETSPSETSPSATNKGP
jgi:hypothetical protein